MRAFKNGNNGDSVCTKHKPRRQKNGAGIFYIIDDPESGRNYPPQSVFGISVNGNLEIPGGKQEMDDKTLIHTAVRESIEECGIHPKFYPKLIKHIQSHKVCSELAYGNGKYVIYMVKIKSFDFSAANEAAENRISTFATMDFKQKQILSPLVEMKKFVPMTGLIREGVRNRDKAFMMSDDFVDTMNALSESDIPVFGKVFDFVDFNSTL
jgi:8-oxo-dGTP pyrophosphatase MutT (NUDIX family)